MSKKLIVVVLSTVMICASCYSYLHKQEVKSNTAKKNSFHEGDLKYQLDRSSINQGDSDKDLTKDYPKIETGKVGTYTIFYYPILRGYEGIQLISKNSKLVYAHFHTCMGGHTYFNDKDLMKAYNEIQAEARRLHLIAYRAEKLKEWNKQIAMSKDKASVLERTKRLKLNSTALEVENEFNIKLESFVGSFGTSSSSSSDFVARNMILNLPKSTLKLSWEIAVANAEDIMMKRSQTYIEKLELQARLKSILLLDEDGKTIYKLGITQTKSKP